jgi:hypothetical protein
MSIHKQIYLESTSNMCDTLGSRALAASAALWTSAETIQLFWRERRCKLFVFYGMVEEDLGWTSSPQSRILPIEQINLVVNPMNPETADEIEYCVKYANFLRNQKMLVEYLDAIEQGLWDYHENQVGLGWEFRQGQGFYNRTEIACKMLKERLW